MEQLVIVGCGGFGREVADVVDAINAVDPTFELLGFADDAPSDDDLERVDRIGSCHLGTCREVLQGAPAHFVVGIGDGAVRRIIDLDFTNAGWSAATLMHPSATTGAGVDVGAGSVVCAGVRMTTNIRLGRHVHVNLNSTIGHDCTLEDYVTVNPLVAVSGNVSVGSCSMLGTHCAVLQNIAVGRNSTVGGSALVVRDVADDTVVKGVPAR